MKIIIRKKIFWLFTFFNILFAASPQHTISGFVKDAATGENLIGANIFDSNSKQGTSSNTYGFFSLTLYADSIKMVVAYLGYEPYKKNIYLITDILQNIYLKPTTIMGDTIVVEEAVESIVDKTQMSVIHIPLRQIQSTPALLGETDVLKTVQLLPGVQSGNEGSSGLYVRGGGPDQNLILLDGASVYNVSHVFGLFSVFNPDAVNNINLIKGGFPARYGGRLSSVLDINLKEGNMKDFKGSGTIGVAASKLMLEGPLIKNKTSFMVSGRRSYIDLLTRPFQKGKQKSGYYFYDLNTKINHIFNQYNRLYLSFYSGNDTFYESYKASSSSNEKFNWGWGNTASTLRWNRIFNNKIFSNLMIIYTKYRFNLKNENDYKNSYSSFNQYSGIRDWGGKIDFEFIPSPKHYFRFGIGSTAHQFEPGALRIKESDNYSSSDTLITPTGKIFSNEYSFYFEDDYKISYRFRLNMGIYSSYYTVRNENYFSFQPRISFRYLLANSIALKGAYAQMRQNIHLLANNSYGLPTDLWVPATDKIKPQQAKQFSFGLAYAMREQEIEISLEGYYKPMNNLIEYKEGASLFGLESGWEHKVEIGSGKSYGWELFIHKKRGKLTGWFGYTLAWANREFENLNNGNTFPYKYDRRNDISLTLSYKFSDKITFAGNWVYGSGKRFTLPIAKYNINEEEVFYYGKRNDFSMSAYHRMDMSLNYFKKGKSRESIWTLGIYNVYNHQNPFYIYFETYDNIGITKAKQVTLLPIIPAISYSYNF